MTVNLGSDVEVNLGTGWGTAVSVGNLTVVGNVIVNDAGATITATDPSLRWQR